ncbi:MAG: putative GntR-family regulator [Blastococcus sp.]|nr:putative GntR-family regulator [Blastococcus sp.]
MMDLDGPEPLYIQIAGILRRRIADGTYPPRSKIPSAEALRAEFGVSRVTAVNAVGILLNEKLVQGVVGKGTYVSEPPETSGED